MCSNFNLNDYHPTSVNPRGRCFLCSLPPQTPLDPVLGYTFRRLTLLRTDAADAAVAVSLSFSLSRSSLFAVGALSQLVNWEARMEGRRKMGRGKNSQRKPTVDLLTEMQLIMWKLFSPKRKDRRETRKLWISDLAHVYPAGPRGNFTSR